MPTIINDALIDILPLVLTPKKHNKLCYLCTRTLDKPRKVAKLPPQYQICCMCRKALKTIAKRHQNYNDVIEIMEKGIEKLILSQGKVKKKDFTDLELTILQLFHHISFEEKEKVKTKLTWFFISR